MEFSISDKTYIDESWYYVNKGDLLIESVSDNTIPHWMMDCIQELLYFSKFKDKFQGYYAEDLGEKELPYYDWNHKPALKHKKSKIKSIQRVHLV